MTTSITQENIQIAVNGWCANPTDATVTYGHTLINTVH